MKRASYKTKGKWNGEAMDVLDCDFSSCIDHSDHSDVEDEDTPSLKTGVQIVNLVKQYSRKGHFPPAVDHLNLSMKEGEITTLLGHNGAGTFETWDAVKVSSTLTS